MPDITVEGVAAGLHAVIRLAEPGSVDLVLTEAARHDLALDDVLAIVDRHTTGRTAAVLGEPRVNVVELNDALEQLAR